MIHLIAGSWNYFINVNLECIMFTVGQKFVISGCMLMYAMSTWMSCHNILIHGNDKLNLLNSVFVIFIFW